MKSKPKTQLCLCTIISPVLFFNKVSGTLPIFCSKLNCARFCKFGISKRLIYYSCFIQLFYIAYTIVTTIVRVHSPKTIFTPDWYVMTFGYILAEVTNLLVLIFGVLYAKDICDLIQSLSLLMNNSPELLRHLKKIIRILLVSLSGSYIIVLSSYAYLAWTRHKIKGLKTFSQVLDSYVGVLIRGISLMIPQIQLITTITLCTIISLQFNNLSQKIYLFLRTSFKPQKYTVIDLSVGSTSPSISNEKLNQLVDSFENLVNYLETINDCIGFPVLGQISTDLYTVVAYLYRYVTASHSSLTSRTEEKYHYIILLFYRVIKLLLYIILGRIVNTNSRKPLKTLKTSTFVTSSVELQQQVQTLILQWSSRTTTLSYYGILNVGPWLIPPILGNVVTYLLVVLQFQGSSKDVFCANNVTLMMH